MLEQGSGTQNPNMLAYGEEGALDPDSHLYVVNDTFVTDLHRGAAVLVGGGVRDRVLAENDISTGSPVFVSQAGAALRHNCLTARPRFVHARQYDYRLRTASPCRGPVPGPGRAQGFSLAPRFQYAGLAGRLQRTDGGTVTGAFGRTGNS